MKLFLKAMDARWKEWVVCLFWALMFVMVETAMGARIKDLASVKGVRNNQLVGYGIVVGLAGTGDKGFTLTNNSLELVLEGIGVDQKLKDLEAKNAAAVMVSTLLPPFTSQGSVLDITVSSIGSAASLEGGTLMMTALKGPDGKVYAMAQGKLVSTKKSGRRSGNTPTLVASVPGGAIVEKELKMDFSELKEVDYKLLNADFTTAARIAHIINMELGGKYATAQDGGTVHVIFPYHHYGSSVEMLAKIENLNVEADRRAKVVINQRSGTVVLGAEVSVLPVAIAHNNLKIQVRNPAAVPTEGGEESGEPATKEETVMMMENGATISEIVSSLNAMGASAEDLVALVQSLKASGALMAELVVQ